LATFPPPSMPHPSKNCGVVGLLRRHVQKKGIDLRHWWFGSVFQRHSSNAASHRKKQLTWGIWPPLMPRPEKNPPAALVVWFRVCSGVGDVSSFDAASLQKNNQPEALVASTTQRKKNSTCGIGGLAPHFQRHWRHSFNAASPKKSRRHCWPPLKPRTGCQKKTAALVVWLRVSSGIGDVAFCDIASPPKTINLRHCWLSSFDATSKKSINLQHGWFGSAFPAVW